MRVGRTLRAIRHLRWSQALAQAQHTITRGRRPAAPSPSPPEWALGGWPTKPLPAPRHAQWDGQGRIELIGGSAEFGSVDRIRWDHEKAGPLFAYQLHFFEWARCAGVASEERAAAIRHWIASCDSGVGWDSHPISVRTLSWLALRFADGAAEAIDDEIDRAMRSSLDRQIETLCSHLETRLQANHLLENRLAVVAGGLALKGARSERWLAEIDPLLADLAEQFGPDGAHYERSPMYHSVLLGHVLDVLAIAQAVGSRAPAKLVDGLSATAARALSALSVVTHPDGRIALLGDSAFGIAAEPEELRRYARSLGVVPALAPDVDLLRSVGHARIHRGDFALIASFAGPSPPHQPGHAHCDALSFEMSVGGERVVVDTGVYEYVPGERRAFARSTGAHATLRIAGREQAEMWAGHRVGGRPEVELVSAVPGRVIEATCASWSTRRTVHRRRFEADGEGVRIEDWIEGEATVVRATLPFAPGLSPELESDGASLRVNLSSDAVLRVELPLGFDWRLTRAPYFPEFGCEVDRALLIGDAASFRRGHWLFRIER